MVIAGTRRSLGAPFEHLAFDAFGLKAQNGRGAIVASYLAAEFAASFRLVKERSEIGLAKLLSERGKASVGLAFIDGGHLFETVMADFTLADLLCCIGGHIVFHDACFPAIETVINYVRCNRPDYAVTHLPVPNLSVLQKIHPDRRPWHAFTPFPVPDRHDWTEAPEAEIQLRRRDAILRLQRDRRARQE